MTKTLYTLMTATLVLFSFSAQAEGVVYKLEYAKDSPITDVSLKNAQIKLEMYSNDNPNGFRVITTDAKGAFVLDQGYNFEVVSIENEEQKGARCSGSATPTATTISIKCNATAKTE